MRTFATLSMVVLMMLATASVALAGRGDPPPPPPPPTEITAVCFERTGDGTGSYKVSGECNRAHHVIEFDGSTPWSFCMNDDNMLVGQEGLNVLFRGQCASGYQHVTLTGDGTFEVGIAPNGQVHLGSGGII